jgi:hypothetical protein
MESSVANALLFAHSAFVFREEQLRSTTEELHALKSSYASLHAELESLKAKEAAAVPAAAPEAAHEAAPEAAPEKKNPGKFARIFAHLPEVLADGTKLSLTSRGERWEGTFTNGKLVFQGKVFNTPYAVGTAHARVISESHPEATKPGNGWVWIKIEDGPYAKKTLAQAYDAHFSA